MMVWEKWPLNLNKIKRPLFLAYFLQASIIVTHENKDKRRLLETDWPYFKGDRSLDGILNQRTWYSLTKSSLALLWRCGFRFCRFITGQLMSFFFIAITEMEECRAPYITGGHVWGPGRCTHCTLWEKWRTGGADGSGSQQYVGWSCISGWGWGVRGGCEGEAGGEQFDGVRHTQTCHYQTSSLTGLNRRITVQVGGRKGDGSEQHIYN